MILAFEQPGLREQCENQSAMDSLHGRVVGWNLRALLADVRAAPTLGDLPVGTYRIERVQPLKLVFPVCGNFVVVAVPNHTRKGVQELLCQHSDMVWRIRIVYIGDEDGY